MQTERRPLTRDRIVDVALRVADEEGLEAVSMRRIGRELGVEAMSLYHHVADKDAIMLALLERILSEFDLPEGPPEDWIERLRLMARAFRRLLLRHPGVVPLFSGKYGPMTSPRALRPIEATLDTLRGAGLSEADTIHAYRALVGLVVGNVLLELGGFFGDWRQREGWPEAEEVLGMLPVEELPTIASMLGALWECDPHSEFEEGLDVMLAGLRSRLMDAPADG